MNHKGNNHMVDLLFTLTLFGVFAAASLLVVIFGAKIYQNTVNHMEENFTSRTAVSYIAEKFRQCDTEGGIQIVNYEGIDVLLLESHPTEDITLTTCIYQDGGYLKELAVTDRANLKLAAGQKIMELSDLTMDTPDMGLFRFSVVDEKGHTETVLLSQKAGEAGN